VMDTEMIAPTAVAAMARVIIERENRSRIMSSSIFRDASLQRVVFDADKVRGIVT
jgi:hypothetical protein